MSNNLVIAIETTTNKYIYNYVSSYISHVASVFPYIVLSLLLDNSDFKFKLADNII